MEEEEEGEMDQLPLSLPTQRTEFKILHWEGLLCPRQ